MDFLLKVQAEAELGATLDPPLVVRYDGSGNIWTQGSPEQLSAYISIIDEAGETVLAPPRTDLVVGNLCGSVHILDGASEFDEEDQLSFLTFPHLAFKRAGKYRIRVSLMRHDAIGGQGATTVDTISSDIIHVARNARQILLGEKEKTVSKILRHRGLHIEY